jgi:hypothetical protein
MEIKEQQNKWRKVIVRAWGEEPVMLFLHRIENNRCYVGTAQAMKPIGLPINQVFAFDSHKFSTMREAYENREYSRLAALYESFTLDDYACNKYQDNVRSLHDQENVTDSERIASGNNQ